MRTGLGVILSLAILLLFTPLARAADFALSESSTYDAIANLLISNSTNAQDQGQCASTSLINSFQYLQAAYPAVYGTSGALTGGNGTANAVTSRNQLDANITGGSQGGLQGDVWNAKLNWVNSKAPGTTVFSGVSNIAVSNSQGMEYNVPSQPPPQMSFNQTGSQMWAWAQGQIATGEDVELGLFNHMTLLIGMVQSGTNMYAEIVDPNLPTPSGTGANNMPNGPAGEWVGVTYDATTGTANLLQMSGFAIGSGTLYSNPGGPPGTADIFYAFAESPAPEPATVTLLAVGATLLAGYRWRRRSKARSLALAPEATATGQEASATSFALRRGSTVRRTT